MPAYLKPIPLLVCRKETCTRKAVASLYNSQNSLLDHYCAVHAEQALEEHNIRVGEVPC